VWPNKEQTNPPDEILVYWSEHDINRVVEEYADGVTDKFIEAGGGNRFAKTFCQISTISVTAFSIVTSVGSSAFACRPMHYQRLLSARNSREAVRNDEGVMSNSKKLARSYVRNASRYFKDVFSG
jgi:hypothetical protein